MRKIVYLGYFAMPDHYRACSPAAVTMMNYVNGALNSAGYDTVIISPAQDGVKTFSREEIRVNSKSKVIFTPTYKSVNKYNVALRALHKVLRGKDLYNELYNIINENDILIVYHSLAYINILKRLRKTKKFNLVLQVCEIYADVLKNPRKKILEMQWIDSADAYIFSTELLENKLNIKQKPYVIAYGTYLIEKDRACKFGNGKIHCVYAGTFDPRKGGAGGAVAAAEFLDERYHVHIIGFGSERDKKGLLDTIERILKKTKCKLTYDGLKSGEDYIRFIQSCDIGLSTQMPDAAFNNTSFPSKVLSYLANGLRVISIRIKALETSSINDLLFYYDKNTPEEIAKAILAVDNSAPYDSRTRIEKLNVEFIDNLKKLLNIMEKGNI